MIKFIIEPDDDNGSHFKINEPHRLEITLPTFETTISDLWKAFRTIIDFIFDNNEDIIKDFVFDLDYELNKERIENNIGEENE